MSDYQKLLALGQLVWCPSSIIGEPVASSERRFSRVFEADWQDSVVNVPVPKTPKTKRFVRRRPDGVVEEADSPQGPWTPRRADKD